MTLSPPRRILVIEDDATLNRLLAEQVTRFGHQALSAGSRAAALQILAGQKVDLAILDLGLPDSDGFSFLPELREYCPVIVLTALGTIELAVLAVRAGASDFLVKPTPGQGLELAINRVLGTAELQRDLAFWQGQARLGQNRPLLGDSPEMQELRRLISLFAGADSPVLVLGEEGSGKETCAMELHALSPRSNGRFVSVDCAAGATAEELLGGMWTDPEGRIRHVEGLIAAADSGTIYLAGIDRLPGDLQNRLLRILETGSYRPVGSNTLLPCAARLIFGSTLSADDIAADPDPQCPLLFRMLSFVIQMPALRDRPGDIREMAETLLQNRSFQRNTRKAFSPAALRALQAHRWPGNLRELSNAVERSIIMSAGMEMIGPEHLGLGTTSSSKGTVGKSRSGEVVLRFEAPPSLDDLRSAYLRFLLDHTSENRREMARILGISERNLYRLLPQVSRPEGTRDPPEDDTVHHDPGIGTSRDGST